jgi:hypothetical protein
MALRIQLRHDIASSWEQFNPVLFAGEIGYDITNKVLKVGDGVNN